jgi:ribosomal protein L11 methyltransferase
MWDWISIGMHELWYVSMDSRASWIEVSLQVDGELAEAVAEVLGRYVSGGVVIESTEIVDEPNGEGYPVGLMRVCGYLPVDEKLDESRQRLNEALWYLGRIRPLPQPVFTPVYETNWMESWKQHYRPISVGTHILIIPAWMEKPGGERLVISIDPGMAFGTGTHPTTQLCLEILENLLVQNEQRLGLNPRESGIIDVGCGSGILSIAALKLGLGWAVGIDIDADAIATAQQNAAVNDVADRLELGVGSVAEIKAGEFTYRRAPLVVANILAVVLVRLLCEGLGDLLIPNGLLVLSGILEEQEEQVVKAVEDNGLMLVDRFQQADWVALVVSKP